MNEITIAGQTHKVINIPGRPPVMLDKSVAELYEVGTKEINQARTRNPDKFPLQFAFQLTPSELSEAVTICDRPVNQHIPWFFTWEGCNMLATILKSDIATQRAIQIVRGFTSVERGVQQTPLNRKEFMAQAYIMAQEELVEIAEERRLLLEDNKAKDGLITNAKRRIGLLECKKDVRATEARIQDAPQKILEHYCFSNYREAHFLIYKEFQRATKTNLQHCWNVAKKVPGKSGLKLYEFLIEHDLADKYIQVVDALLENESGGYTETQDSWL